MLAAHRYRTQALYTSRTTDAAPEKKKKEKNGQIGGPRKDKDSL